MKTALVTGASSGIGREIAARLDSLGFRVILCARRTDRLEELAAQLKNDAVIITADLSDRAECYRLYEETKELGVSVLINNAGFGAIGCFDETDLDRELSMLDVNCAAVHILTKLFLKDFLEKDRGFILNVASSAGLMPGGPLMAAYYATKAYVVSLTRSISEELRAKNTRVSISALCPGPVETEFNDVASCEFAVKGISAKQCAEEALKGLFARETIVVPGTQMKLAALGAKHAPSKPMLKATMAVQSAKIKDKDPV
ncbi:MAG: SDR family oxidoreductase [Ruminococcus sp.]|nr:SDR family oxidoreductase [Ruminococcus sp.]